MTLTANVRMDIPAIGSSGYAAKFNALFPKLDRASARFVNEWAPPGAADAIADGTLHPLSEFYGSLAAAQADYSFAVALTDSAAWVAWQACINSFNLVGANIGGLLSAEIGNYVLNRGLVGSGKGNVEIRVPRSNTSTGGVVLSTAVATPNVVPLQWLDGGFTYRGLVFLRQSVVGTVAEAMAFGDDGSGGITASGGLVEGCAAFGFGAGYGLRSVTDTVFRDNDIEANIIGASATATGPNRKAEELEIGGGGSFHNSIDFQFNYGVLNTINPSFVLEQDYPYAAGNPVILLQGTADNFDIYLRAKDLSGFAVNCEGSGHHMIAAHLTNCRRGALRLNGDGIIANVLANKDASPPDGVTTSHDTTSDGVEVLGSGCQIFGGVHGFRYGVRNRAGALRTGGLVDGSSNTSGPLLDEDTTGSCRLFVDDASFANRPYLGPSAAGAPTEVYPRGTDANIKMTVRGKGTGGVVVGETGGRAAAYGGTPIAKQTGVPVTAAGIHAALVALGWFSA